MRTNVVKAGSVRSRRMEPAWARMIWRERARPTPVPSARVVKKGSKMWSAFSSGMGVGDVDLGVIGGVDECGDTDEGHVVEGSGSRSGLLPEPVTQGIERILQDVGDHLPHQLLVGEEDHVVIL